MTRKDYTLIAETIQATRQLLPPGSDGLAKDAAYNAILDAHAIQIARRLEATETRFNKARFLAACGVT